MLFELMDDNQRPLDAHLEIDGKDIVFHSRGGAKASSPRNSEYGRALRLLIQRISSTLTKIDAVYVDSTNARQLPLEHRRILEPEESSRSPEDIYTLLTSRMKHVGQTPNANVAGGNPTKKLRIRLADEVGKPLMELLGLVPSDAHERRHLNRLPASAFEKLRPDHIKRAIDRLIAGETHPFGPSTDYDLVTPRNIMLPPKAVFGLAATEALGFEVLPMHFVGGPGTICFKILESAGCTIVQKPKGTIALASPIVDGHFNAEERRRILSGSGKIFLTKTWGFDPKHYPVFGFSQEGARENFLRQASRGDWIAIAGTRRAPTSPAEQGRILGMCQVGHEKIDADKVLKSIGTELSAGELDKDGLYIWRWAMPMTQAIVFSPQPDLKDVFGSYLPGNEWATYARDLARSLGQDAIQKIFDLRGAPTEIAKVPILKRETAFAEAVKLQRKYGPSGPPPSGTKAGSERELGIGFAYAFELLGSKLSSVFKIGCTRDPSNRLNQLNAELRFHLTGCKWQQRLIQAFPSELHSYRFEQSILARLQLRLVEGDREVVQAPWEEIEKEWVSVFSGKKWAEID